MTLRCLTYDLLWVSSLINFIVITSYLLLTSITCNLPHLSPTYTLHRYLLPYPKPLVKAFVNSFIVWTPDFFCTLLYCSIFFRKYLYHKVRSPLHLTFAPSIISCQLTSFQQHRPVIKRPANINSPVSGIIIYRRMWFGTPRSTIWPWSSCLLIPTTRSLIFAICRGRL